MLAAVTVFHMETVGSKAAAEMHALCDPEYTDYLLRVTEARHAALNARILFEGLKKQLDLVRTFESSRRCGEDLFGVLCFAGTHARVQAGDADSVRRIDCAEVERHRSWFSCCLSQFSRQKRVR